MIIYILYLHINKHFTFVRRTTETGYKAELTSTLLSDSKVPSASRIYAGKPCQKPKNKETPRSGEQRVIPGTACIGYLPVAVITHQCLGNKLKCILFKFSSIRQITEVTKVTWVSAVVVCVFNKMYINNSKELDTAL